jgi:hypothetical protein
VVTVVDPRHPGPLRDVLVAVDPPSPRLPLRPPERLLGVAVLLLLLVALAGARALHAGQRETGRLAALHLVAVPTGGGPVLGSRDSFMSLELLLTGSPDEALPLRRFGVDHGWRSTGAEPRAFATGQRLFLRHPLDCGREVVLPQRLTLLVAVGGAARTLLVPVAQAAAGTVADLREVCGRLTVAQSLSLVSSRGPVPVVLELANTSLDGLTLEALRADGFAFRAVPPLPLRLEGRAAGILRFGALTRHRLRVEAAVTDCTRARASLLRGAGRAGVVDAVVSRPGERAAATLAGQGLEVLLQQKWLAACSRK